MPCQFPRPRHPDWREERVVTSQLELLRQNLAVLLHVAATRTLQGKDSSESKFNSRRVSAVHMKR